MLSEQDKIVARIAGAVLFLFGLGLAPLCFGILILSFFKEPSLESGIQIGLFVVGAIGAFCLLVGFRLLFNRPNRYGSLLSPLLWNILCYIFCAIGLYIIICALTVVSYGLINILYGIISIVFGFYCRIAAGQVKRRGINDSLTSA